MSPAGELLKSRPLGHWETSPGYKSDDPLKLLGHINKICSSDIQLTSQYAHHLIAMKYFEFHIVL